MTIRARAAERVVNAQLMDNDCIRRNKMKLLDPMVDARWIACVDIIPNFKQTTKEHIMKLSILFDLNFNTNIRFYIIIN